MGRSLAANRQLDDWRLAGLGLRMCVHHCLTVK